MIRITGLMDLILLDVIIQSTVVFCTHFKQILHDCLVDSNGTSGFCEHFTSDYLYMYNVGMK